MVIETNNVSWCLLKLTMLVETVSGLFTNRKIIISGSLEQDVLLDPIQIEQVMINLIKNADEAMLDNNSSIRVNIIKEQNKVFIDVIDLGVGIKNTHNLFTPFYTTKKQGSGIGLVLCRQIIEAHKGYLSIQNNAEDQKGVTVRITLPI